MDTSILHTPSYNTKMLIQTGMKSRKKTVLEKAKNISKKCGESQDLVPGFLSYLSKLNQSQQAVVTLLLIEEGHANLLDATLQHNYTPYQPHQILSSLVSHHDNNTIWQTLWPLLKRHDLDKSIFSHFSVLPNDLPFEAWLALDETLKKHTKGTFTLHVPKNIKMTADHFVGTPSDTYDKKKFGACVETLYQHYEPRTDSELLESAHGLPFTIPSLFPRSSIQLIIAFLSGWSPQIVRNYFPLVSASKSGTQYGHLYEARLNKAKSSHDWMAFAQDIKNLSPKEKHEAITILKHCDSPGGFGKPAMMPTLLRDPTLSKLLHIP